MGGCRPASWTRSELGYVRPATSDQSGGFSKYFRFMGPTWPWFTDTSVQGGFGTHQHAKLLPTCDVVPEGALAVEPAQ